MAAAAMTPEQQAIVLLHQDLAQLRQIADQTSNAHNALRAAHDALNIAAQQALAEKDQKIRESEDKLKSLIFRQQFDLLDSKELKPDHFRGRVTDAFKPWQRKFQAFCNSTRTGFRAALEWAGKQPAEIHDFDAYELGPCRGCFPVASGLPFADSRGECIAVGRQAGARRPRL